MVQSTCAEGLHVPSIRNKFAPYLTALYRWAGVVDSYSRYTDSLRTEAAGLGILGLVIPCAIDVIEEAASNSIAVSLSIA